MTRWRYRTDREAIAADHCDVMSSNACRCETSPESGSGVALEHGFHGDERLGARDMRHAEDLLAEHGPIAPEVMR